MARNGFQQPNTCSAVTALYKKLFEGHVFSIATATANAAVAWSLSLAQSAALLLLLSLVLFAPEASHAVYPLESFPSYIGIRGLGMGGAQINAVNDETAILTNPAALGKLRNTFATVLDPELAANDLAMQSLAGQGISDDPQVMLDLLNRYPNRYYYTRAQIMPSIVLQNFGFGVFGIDARAAYTDSTTNTMSLAWRRDAGAVLAYNFRLWEGRIKIGASARVFNRFEVSASEFSTSTTGLALRDIANEGGAVGADLGVILSAPIRFLPSISAVVRDVGNTEFTVGKGYFLNVTGIPATQRQAIDAGFALFPILGKTTRMTIAGEFRNLTSQNESDKTDFFRRAHVGAEVNFSDVIFFRGGMHQRYWTGGLEISTEHFQIQGASYGQEIGTPAAPKEDRRWVGKIVFRY